MSHSRVSLDEGANEIRNAPLESGLAEPCTTPYTSYPFPLMSRRSNTQPRPALLSRGVYRHPFLRSGCPVYFAITSGGELAGEMVADGIRVTEAMAQSYLGDLLALCDAPHLMLVSSSTPDRLCPAPVAEIPAQLLRRPRH